MSCKNSLLSLKRRRFRVSLWSPSWPLTLSHPCHPCSLQSAWITSVHHHSWMKAYVWCFRSLLGLTTAIRKLFFLECFGFLSIHKTTPSSSSSSFFFLLLFILQFFHISSRSITSKNFQMPFQNHPFQFAWNTCFSCLDYLLYLRLCVTVISTISFPICDFLLEFENLL